MQGLGGGLGVVPELPEQSSPSYSSPKHGGGGGGLEPENFPDRSSPSYNSPSHRGSLDGLESGVRRRSYSADVQRVYERPRTGSGWTLGGSVGVPGSSSSFSPVGRLGSSQVLLGEKRASSGSSRTRTFAGLSTPQSNASRRRDRDKSQSGSRKHSPAESAELERAGVEPRDLNGEFDLPPRRHSESDIKDLSDPAREDTTREKSPSNPVVKPSSSSPPFGLTGTLTSFASSQFEGLNPTRQPRSRARSGSPRLLGEPRSNPPSRSRGSRSDVEGGSAFMGLRPAPRMRSTSPGYLMDRMDRSYLLERRGTQMTDGSRSPSESQKHSGANTPTGSVTSFGMGSTLPEGPLVNSFLNYGGYLHLDELRMMQEAAAAQERDRSQHPIHIEAVREDTNTNHTASESARDVSVYLLMVLFLGWAFCVVSWLWGVCLPSASLDFLPGTEMQWHVTKSLAQTLQKLYDQQIVIGFCALGFFSVIVPIMKISCTFMLIYKIASSPVHTVFVAHRMLVKTLSYLASYQFVDLYCGILFVCLFNADASDARFEVGFYWFFSYCIASLATSLVLDYVFEIYEKAAIDQADVDLEHLAFRGGSPVDSASNSIPLQLQQYETVVPTDLEGHDAFKLQLRHVQAANSVDVVDVVEVLNVAGNVGANDRCGQDSMRRVTPANSGFLDHLLPRGSAGHIRKLCEWSLWVFSACFLVCVLLTFWDDMLEVRMLMHDIAVDRQTLSVRSMLINDLPSLANPVIVVFMWLAMVAFPFAYTAAVLVISEAHRRERSGVHLRQWQQVVLRAAEPIPDLLRQWAMADVMLIAILIFLFMIQDAHTLTMPPDGSFAFYIFIGAGLTLFILRWFVDIEGKPPSEAGFPGASIFQGSNGALISYMFLIVFWVITWLLIARGVPGSAPHYSYSSLSAVCEHTFPFMTQAVRQLPASFGNCKDMDSKPPQPCIGEENLHTEGDDNGYMNAIWIAGMRSTEIQRCLLTKGSTADSSTTKYYLVLGGTFGHLDMFLRVKSCTPIGCARINSSDNCCGSNLGFNLSFELSCRPAAFGVDAIKNIEFDQMEVDPMLVKTDLMGGALQLDAMDIAPQVESAVKSQVKDMLKRHVPWGGKPLNLEQILNKIVWYNAPSRAGKCF